MGERRELLLPSDPLYGRIVQFLYDEAALLDTRRFEEWLELLTEDVAYLAPIPIDEASAPGGFAADGHYFYEDMVSLRQRVQRLRTGFAWAEDPPSRTCHLISNVRAASEGPDIMVHSNFLVYRSRGDAPRPDLLAGERQDVLRPSDASFKLARREVFLAQSVLGLPSLSFLF